MSAGFDQAFQRVVLIEGGYVNDPADSGGATRYGITEAVARAYHYTGKMSELPLEIARAIYKRRYWDALNLDAIYRRAPGVAEEMFDTAVNTGPGMAGKWLQRSLNVLNQRGSKYADIAVDGIVGEMTVAALSAYLAGRGAEGEEVLLKALNALQGAFYIALAERRSKDEKFVYGWLRARVT